MKPLASNTLLQNRYLVVHLIGRGGMGEVYLAIDQRLGSAVAVKRTAFFEDELLGGAFEREAKILARLRHPALPKVSDHFLEDGNQYLVMEYIAGDDLSKRLQNSNRPFPLDWVMFWADKILDALDYLHSFEPPIIHRDIKPQNLKLTEDNQIVLLDFGLSKNTVDVARVSTSAAPSVVGYTTQYAPIEQIRGTGTSARSDIFSLSSTLYQLLTNQVPPDALTRADAILSGKTDPLAPPSEINPQVPEAISAIVLKGMEISREKRTGTAREMQKLLRDAFSTPAMRGQNFAQAAASPVQAYNENISLKTNVTSTPIASVHNSPTETHPASERAQFDSASLPKPVLRNSPLGSFNGTGNGAPASHPTERIANDFPSVRTEDFIPARANAGKKSSLIFAAVGAFLLAFAAIGFSFYKYHSAVAEDAKYPSPAIEIKPSSSVESAAQQQNTQPGNAAITNTEEPASDSSSESDKLGKEIQPSSEKINQKPAQSSERKNPKPAAKSPAKSEQKPTPLPRILP